MMISAACLKTLISVICRIRTAVVTTPYLSLDIYRPRHVALRSLVSSRRVRQQDFTAKLWEQSRNVSVRFVRVQLAMARFFEMLLPTAQV